MIEKCDTISKEKGERQRTMRNSFNYADYLVCGNYIILRIVETLGVFNIAYYYILC